MKATLTFRRAAAGLAACGSDSNDGTPASDDATPQ